MRDFRKPGSFKVFLGHERSRNSPIDLQARIIPKDGMFIRRVVEIAALVKELHAIGESQKTVREASGNIDLILFFRGQEHCCPLSEIWRTHADVHGHVQGLAFDNAAQLCLWMAQLVMKSPQRAFRGIGMVVLNECIGNAKFGNFAR